MRSVAARGRANRRQQMVEPVAPATTNAGAPAAQPIGDPGKPTQQQIQAFGRALYNATAANPPLSDGGGTDDDPDDDGSNTLKLSAPPMPILTPTPAAPATAAASPAATKSGT
jgi:hypothetical protein